MSGSEGLFESELPVPSRLTFAPEATVCGAPALATGGWSSVWPVVQVANGAVTLGQGFNCPSTPTAGAVGEALNGTYGPKPFTRNGNSWNVSGTVGLPITRFSGNK